MYSFLYNSFSKYIQLTDEELEHCFTFFRYKRFRRRQYILQEEQSPGCSLFVLDGLVRLYEADDKGQEHILCFGEPCSWILCGEGMIGEAGLPFNVDCIEDTEVLMLSGSSKAQLVQSVPKMLTFFQRQLQENYALLLQRIGSQLGKSSIEQYFQFIDRYPGIAQRLPNQFLASYLGITPQSLSRIRANARYVAA